MSFILHRIGLKIDFLTVYNQDVWNLNHLIIKYFGVNSVHLIFRIISAPNFPLTDCEKLNDLAGVKNKKARIHSGFRLLILFGDGRVELQGKRKRLFYSWLYDSVKHFGKHLPLFSTRARFTLVIWTRAKKWLICPRIYFKGIACPRSNYEL